MAHCELPADAAGSLANCATPHGSRWRRAIAALVSRATDEVRHPSWSLVLQTTIGLALFLLIEPLFKNCDHLPPRMYQKSCVALAALGSPRLWPPLLFVLALLVVGWRKLAWDQFDLSRQTRWLVGTLAGVLAFAYSLYSYNYYFDQTHLVDRLLLVSYALLVFRHPAFAGLAVLQTFLVVGQFDTLVRCTWTDKLLVFELLILFLAFLATKLMFRRQCFVPYLSAVLIVVGIFYLRSGIGKLELDWLAVNHLERLFLSASHQNGWLAWLGPRGVDAIYHTIARSGTLLMAGTLVIELGVVALLAHRRVAIALLAACILMHAGIFFSSGILFWKWIAVDVALAVVIWRLPTEATRRMFGRPALAFGAVAMLVLHGIYAAPPKLSWYDSSMCFRFTLEAVGESGRIYQVPPYRLAPYDVAFAQARFYYLTEHAQLASCMGALQSERLMTRIDEVNSRAELEQLRQNKGTNSFNRRAAERFDTLLRSYFVWEQRRQRGERRVFPIKSPAHIWTSAHPDLDLEVYAGQEPITSVRIRLDEALQRGGKLVTITDQVIRTIDLPASSNETVQSQLADSQRSLVK